ncbi:MAG: histidine phosphatase family protein [Pseudomonadota bacterium]
MYLLRHASAVFVPSADGSKGQSPDAPLSPEGLQQSDALVAPLMDLGITHIHSSPYARAIATVAPFAKASGLNVVEDNQLRERSRGQGPDESYLGEVERLHMDPAASPWGGESGADVAERGMAGIEAARLAGPVPLVSSHGQFLSVVLGRLGNECGYDGWKSMPNPGLYAVDDAGWWHVPLGIEART